MANAKEYAWLQAPRTVNTLFKSFPFLQASREEQLQQHRVCALLGIPCSSALMASHYSLTSLEETSDVQQVLEKLKFLFANGAEVDLSPAHTEALVLMQHMVWFGLLPLDSK